MIYLHEYKYNIGKYYSQSDTGLRESSVPSINSNNYKGFVDRVTG